MNTGQIQVRLSLTEQLYEFLQAKSVRLGLPVTQVIKHLIVREAEKEEYPTFPASTLAETEFQKSQSSPNSFIRINNVKRYLDAL